MKQIVYTKNAPNPIGPYSQAVIANNMLFCSGQIAIDPVSGEFTNGDIVEQTELVSKNISELLKSVNLTFDSVIKTTCFLHDMNDFPSFNGIYEKYFISKPARSCVAVKTLPKNALVEIEIIASLEK